MVVMRRGVLVMTVPHVALSDVIAAKLSVDLMTSRAELGDSLGEITNTVKVCSFETADVTYGLQVLKYLLVLRHSCFPLPTTTARQKRDTPS